jgi:hypothetical protein
VAKAELISICIIVEGEGLNSMVINFLKFPTKCFGVQGESHKKSVGSKRKDMVKSVTLFVSMMKPELGHPIDTIIPNNTSWNAFTGFVVIYQRYRDRFV